MQTHPNNHYNACRKHLDPMDYLEHPRHGAED